MRRCCVSWPESAGRPIRGENADHSLAQATPRPHRYSGRGDRADQCRDAATTVGLFRAYLRELEPAVTSGLCASKAPNTSSFSRGGTLKCSSVSASTAET